MSSSPTSTSTSGCQSQFRLFDAEQRRWGRVAKEHQQTKITKRTIGQARRRNAEPAFLQKDLNCAAFDDDINIFDARVQSSQHRQQPSLDGHISSQTIKHQPEIPEVLGQKVITLIRLLRLPRRSVPSKRPFAVDADSIELLAKPGNFGILLGILSLRQNRFLGINLLVFQRARLSPNIKHRPIVLKTVVEVRRGLAVVRSQIFDAFISQLELLSSLGEC